MEEEMCFCRNRVKFNIEILLATLAILTEESRFSNPKPFFLYFIRLFNKYLLFMCSVHMIDFVAFFTVDSPLLLETLPPSLRGVY